MPSKPPKTLFQPKRDWFLFTILLIRQSSSGFIAKKTGKRFCQTKIISIREAASFIDGAVSRIISKISHGYYRYRHFQGRPGHSSTSSLQGYGSDIYRINGNKPGSLETEQGTRIIMPVAQQTDFIIQATANLGTRSNRYNANIGLRYQF